MYDLKEENKTPLKTYKNLEKPNQTKPNQTKPNQIQFKLSYLMQK